MPKQTELDHDRFVGDSQQKRIADAVQSVTTPQWNRQDVATPKELFRLTVIVARTVPETTA